jgi:integrase
MDLEFVEPIRDRKRIEAMKEILKASNIRNYVLFTMGINSGLQISDLLNLKVKDVFDGKNIRERITVREGNTGKTKNFLISDTVDKALKEYDVSSMSIDAFLFPSQKGVQRISRIQAYRILNAAAKTLNMDNIGTHTLRKTFGYHAYLAGIDISRIMEQLNHFSQKETLKYIGISRDEIDEIYLNLNL